MENLINALKIVILIVIAILAVSMLIELWTNVDEKDAKIKRKREVLTLEETRDVLWINYIYHFHGGC